VGSSEALKTVAIAPLSHCERAFIAMRKQLNRDAIKPLSQRRKAFIANPMHKKASEKTIFSLWYHVSGRIPSLFRAFWSTFFCCEFYERTTTFSIFNHLIFLTYFL
jgi:hypothetical protein